MRKKKGKRKETRSSEKNSPSNVNLHDNAHARCLHAVPSLPVPLRSFRRRSVLLPFLFFVFFFVFVKKKWHDSNAWLSLDCRRRTTMEARRVATWLIILICRKSGESVALGLWKFRFFPTQRFEDSVFDTELRKPPDRKTGASEIEGKGTI